MTIRPVNGTSYYGTEQLQMGSRSNALEYGVCNAKVAKVRPLYGIVYAIRQKCIGRSIEMPRGYCDGGFVDRGSRLHAWLLSQDSLLRISRSSL
jgi:hypothetical protein